MSSLSAIAYFSLFLSTALFVLSILKFYKTRGKARLPPSPLSLPIIGHAYLIGPLLHRSLRTLAERYGQLMYLRLGSIPTVIISSAEMAKEFLKTHELDFASRPSLSGSKLLAEYSASGLTFAPYGPYWRFMKRISMMELLSGRQLDRFLTIRQQEIQLVLISLFQKSGAGELVDMGGLLAALANNVVCRMAMSTRCSGSKSEAEEIRMGVREIVETSGKFNLEDFLGLNTNFDIHGYRKRLREAYEKYDELVERIMKEHQEKMGGEKDFMDILLDLAQDEKAEIKLTRQNIKTFLLDIFVAGTEVSSLAMQWALAELINHPIVFKKAREEIDSVVGKGRLVQESDVSNLPYLQAIVKETLRLHPSSPLLLRESIRDCNIRDFDIPAKTRLFVNVWAIGRDPNSWEDPLEFHPERFIGDEKQVDLRGMNFELLPFGSGRRGCPGASLGLNMMHGTLAAMIQCFDWKVEGNKVDMREGPGFTLTMAHPFKCFPISHFNPFASASLD